MGVVSVRENTMRHMLVAAGTQTSLGINLILWLRAMDGPPNFFGCERHFKVPDAVVF